MWDRTLWRKFSRPLPSFYLELQVNSTASFFVYLYNLKIYTNCLQTGIVYKTVLGPYNTNVTQILNWTKRVASSAGENWLKWCKLTLGQVSGQ